MNTHDLGNTVISPSGMTVRVTDSYGIKAWLALWTHQGDDFQDGRDFVVQHREITTYIDEGGNKTRSGTIQWEIVQDGLYEYGNCPTSDGKHTRGFVHVEGNVATLISYSKKSALVASLPKRGRHGRRADADF